MRKRTKNIKQIIKEITKDMKEFEAQSQPLLEGEAIANYIDEVKPAMDREQYLIQYGIEQGNNYRPTSRTTSTLPPGLYRAEIDERGLYFTKQEIDTSELIRFDNTVADVVISEFDEFWKKKSLYEERGEIHKRGFMLWGPPGGGKTSTVSFIMKDFIKQGNIVFDFNNSLISGIRQFKLVEPDRKIMIIMEDIDAYIMDQYNEQAVLDMLDGSVKHSNTIIIATTNYPERLPDRIINRPSRFDRVECIDVPSEKDRKIYLKQKSKTLKAKDITKWVKDTENWTLAHVKELILSVEVFGLEYQATLDRLNKMREKAEKSADYERQMRGKKEGFGFGK